MNISELLMGTPGGYEQVPLGYSPEQLDATKLALDKWRTGIQNPSAGFEPIAQAARNKYQETVLPTLMERIGVGGLGGAKSAYAQTIAQGARGLESDLAAQQAQYAQGNMSNLNNLLSMGLTRQYDTNINKRIPGLFEDYANERIGGLARKGLEGGLSAFLESLGGSEDASWGEILGKMGSGAATGMGTVGPWGALIGAILPLLARSASAIGRDNYGEAASPVISSLLKGNTKNAFPMTQQQNISQMFPQRSL